MLKNAVLFASDEQKEKESEQTVTQDQATVSREDYRRAVKEAYKEGMNDTIAELKKTNGERKTKISHHQDGKEQAIRSIAKKKEETKQHLQVITNRQTIELMHVKSVFPFSFFPDTLVIDTTKISVVKKQFFATEYILTIPLKDLADVTVQTALFLASLTLEYMPQADGPGMMKPVFVRIVSLKREDAIRAKNILKGALVAKAESIDIASLSPEEVVKILEKFGESQGIS